jgi:uncharacterized protein
MYFEWDTRKEGINIEKHGLSFSEVALIFDSPHFSREDRRFDYGETRLVTIGKIGDDIVIVVVHTSRDQAIRIISARHANPSERKLYDVHCSNQ